MFFFRNRRKKRNVLPICNLPPKTKSLYHEQQRLTWINLALGVLIPLSIGIGTVVITVLQQNLDNRRQEQERELDDRRNSLERYIDDRRYQLEQELTDQSYYQDVYKTYIEDISNVIFKQQNSSIFVDDQARLDYIRSKTLIALDELDWQRKTRVFLFLHENKLLPQPTQSSNKNAFETKPTLDLSGANLFNISLQSTFYRKIDFESLSLPTVDLSNSSFIDCYFRSGGNFDETLMVYSSFKGSLFTCSGSYSFWKAVLIRADFSNALLCEVVFNEADLAYVNFTRTKFIKTIIRSANVVFADFTDADSEPTSVLLIINSNMTGARLSTDLIKLIQMINVILPDGSWYIDEKKNLIRNGDAEEKCIPSLELPRPIPGWTSESIHPILSFNQNSTSTSLNKCYFNFTSDDKSLDMYQTIDLQDYSVFIDSGETVLELSSDINCYSFGDLEIKMELVGSYFQTTSIIKFHLNETVYGKWQRWTSGNKTIPLLTRLLTMYVTMNEQGVLCYLDNIELYIFRNKSM